MNRRHFIKTTSGLVTIAAIAPRLFSAEAERDPLMLTLIRANDAFITAELAKQEKREGHRWQGGIPDVYGIHSVHATGALVAAAVNAWQCPESRYYHKTELIQPVERASRYLLAAQHDNGTIDMASTNFHSTPDVAFLLEHIAPAVELLRGARWSPAANVLAQLEKFTLKAGEALLNGGVHTPNHRWVVCAALARVNVLYPNPKYIARLDQWLAETIDQDPDGQYTEKSTSIYSAVVSHALAVVARLLNRPGLLDHVRRNLDMTFYYVHPDGEVVTEASKRQDKYQRGSMNRYYYCYRWLALRDNNGQYAAMARQIEQTAAGQLDYMLAIFLTEPDLRRPLPPSAPLPTDYAKVFPHSKLARIRRGSISATILAENATLFSLRKGSAALEAVRLASAFFGKGQFVADELTGEGNRLVLRQKLQGVYFQPLTPAEMAANDGQVRMAPNGTLAMGLKAERKLSEVQNLDTTVTVTESSSRFELTIEVIGTEGVPVAVELAFRHGGKLRGVEPLAGIKDGYLLRDGFGEYTSDGEVIKFGPGKAEHLYTQVRGALPKWDGQSVYVTGLTPYRTVLQIS